jgi:hypothetical protein
MDLSNTRPQSPSQIPTSSSKYHHPYFTPAEVEYLSEKQRGKLSVTQEEKTRQQACGFLEAVGAKIGLCVLSFFDGCSQLTTWQSEEDNCDSAGPIPQVSFILSSQGFQLSCMFHCQSRFFRTQ